MTNQSTIDKLISMRMTPMADAFRIQMQDPDMKEVPFEDRFGMLVDIQYTARKNNRLKKLIHDAGFEQPDASVSAIDYGHNRKLNRSLIERLATCEYITEYRNIFLTGASGSGKTYLGCAFGMEACKRFYSTTYIRMPDMMLHLQAARDDHTFTEAIKKYTKPTLLKTLPAFRRPRMYRMEALINLLTAFRAGCLKKRYATPFQKLRKLSQPA